MPTITVVKISPHVEAGVVKITRYFMDWAGGQVKDEKTLSEGGSYTWEVQWDEAPPYKLEFIPSGEYNFVGWRWRRPDGSLGPLQEDRVSYRLASYDIIAYFKSKATYTLILDKQGEGEVTNPGVDLPFPRTLTYHKWDVADIRCYPATGWYFDYFNVDGRRELGYIDNVGGLPMNALDLVMTANHTVICVFGKWLKIEGYLGSGSGYVDITMGDGTISRWSIYNRKAGEQVTLRATGMSGYVFDYYLVNGVKYTDNPLTFILQGDVRYEAYFKAPSPPPPEKVTLTITTTTGGTTSPGPGTYTYDKDSQVTVTAIPDNGYEFLSWGLNGYVSYNNPITVRMTKSLTLKAWFKPVSPPPQTFLLTISVSGNGTTDPAPGSYSHTAGTQVTVTAIPYTNYKFVKWKLTWSGGSSESTSNPITLTMDRDYTLVAFFEPITPKVTLTIATTTGGTTTPAPGTYQYNKGSQVTVTAIPDSGYQFDYWNVNGTKNTSNPITLTLNTDVTLTAYFKSVAPPPPEKVTLTIAVPEHGTTSPAPGTYQYNKGSQVTITAIPASGYEFWLWVINGINFTQNPITLTLNTDTIVVAYFRKVTPPPTGKGRLEVHAYADGREVAAQVSIDTSQYSTPFILDVSPGTYTLKATFYDQEQTKTVVVTEGQTTRVDFTFKAPPPAKAPFPWWIIGPLLFGTGALAAGRKR